MLAAAEPVTVDEAYAAPLPASEPEEPFVEPEPAVEPEPQAEEVRDADWGYVPMSEWGDEIDGWLFASLQLWRFAKVTQLCFPKLTQVVCCPFSKGCRLTSAP